MVDLSGPLLRQGPASRRPRSEPACETAATVALVSAPRVDQINVVVGDVDAVARFLSGLGVDIPTTMPEWDSHHRAIPTATSRHGGHELDEPTFEIDLDSGVFAQEWGGLSPSFTGVVLNLRVDERAEVDRLHGLTLSLGGASLKVPYDAFWGSRYAVVEGPGSLVVGLMSVPDPAHRSAPPDLATIG